MVEGLRILGACSKCGGALSFRDEEPRNGIDVQLTVAGSRSTAPHLVLGLPRR
jgi:hypothetical protein